MYKHSTCITIYNIKKLLCKFLMSMFHDMQEKYESTSKLITLPEMFGRPLDTKEHHGWVDENLQSKV